MNAPSGFCSPQACSPRPRYPFFSSFRKAIRPSRHLPPRRSLPHLSRRLPWPVPEGIPERAPKPARHCAGTHGARHSRAAWLSARSRLSARWRWAFPPDGLSPRSNASGCAQRCSVERRCCRLRCLPVLSSVAGSRGSPPPGAASRFRAPVAGLLDSSTAWLFSTGAAALVLASLLWPLVALQLAPALRAARRSFADAAALAAPRSRVFWRVLLPQARRELAAGALLVFLLAASDFSVCSLLLVRVLPVESTTPSCSAAPATPRWPRCRCCSSRFSERGCTPAC